MKSVFQITIDSSFRAGHQIHFADGTVEDRHEHNWQVTAAVSAPQLDENGFVMDFHKLQAALKAILEPFEGTKLEDHSCFADGRASAENVAKYIFMQLLSFLPGHVHLDYVEVTEQTHCRARYSENAFLL